VVRSVAAPSRIRRGAVAVVASAVLAAVVVAVPGPPAGATGATWTIESELPPNFAFYPSVSCASSLVCTASAMTVASQMSVLGTSDGGAHWSTLYTAAPGTYIGRVLSLSSTAIVALEETPSAVELLHSTDGGASWSSNVVSGINSNPEFFVGVGADLWCASTASCVAVVQQSQQGLDEYATTDLGASWSHRRATVPGLFDGELACVARSECLAGISKGYGPSRLYRTTNAGATWKPLTNAFWPGGSISVACTSLHRCVASAGGSLSFGYLYASSSAGNHWTLVKKSAGWDATSLQCGADGLCAATWAVTHQLGTPSVGVSADGGVTWRRLSVAGATGIADDASCGSPTTCLVPVDQRNDVTGFASTLYATTDGGTTWPAVYGASGPLWLGDVACPSASACLAVGADTTGAFVETSADGGVTWTTVPTVIGAGSSLSSLVCLSPTDCLAIALLASGAEVVRSSDLGTTWVPLSLPDGVGSAFSLSCTSATTCFVMSQTATFVSSDAGATWATATLPSEIASEANIVAAACETATKCFAVATATFFYLPIILSSSDGGLTWSIAKTIKGADSWYADQLVCPSSTHCLSIADASNVFQFGAHNVPLEYALTGSSWAPRYEFGEEIAQLAGVQCQASGACEAAANLATGGTSLELSSTDFGLTWTPSSMPLSYVTAMSCSSSTSCVAVGLDAAGGWTIARGG
jgi:photosystem II stability/assembly factor-like uncharacterized protein